MLTLSFGYQKPQTGDKGNVFFPALEADIQQLNDHNHDGANSSKLTAQSITGVSDTILGSAWVATSGGTYRQAVTMPANVTFDAYGIMFRIKTGGNAGFQVNLSVEKINSNSYYVYINDNSVDLTVLYLV